MRIIFLRLFFPVVLIAACLVLLLPQIASTEWGNRRILEVINSQYPAVTEAKSIQLSWFGPQQIQELVIRDISNRELMNVAEATFHTSLFDLLWRQRPSHVTLSNLNVSWWKTQEKTLHLSKTDGTLNFGSKGQPLTLNLKGTTQEGNLVGRFDLDAQIDGLNFQDLIALDPKNLDKAKLKLRANVVNFPVNLLSELISHLHEGLADFAPLILDQQVNFMLDQAPIDGGTKITLKLQSPLTNGEIVSILDKEGFSIKPSQINLQLTPELSKRFFPYLEFQKPTRATLFIQQFSLPFQIAKENDPLAFDLSKVALAMKLQVPNLSLSYGTLQPFEIDLHAKEEDKQAFLSIQGQIMQKNQPIPFSLQSKFNKPLQWSDIPKQVIPGLCFKTDFQKIPVGSGDSFSDLSIRAVCVSLDESIYFPKNSLAGSLEIEEIAFFDKPVLLKNIQARWNFDTISNSIAMDFSGISQVKKTDKEGKFSGNLLIKDATLELAATSREFPTAFLNMLLPSYNLSAILGDWVDLQTEATANLSELEKGSATFSFNSERINGKGVLHANQLAFDMQLSNRSMGNLILKGVIEDLFYVNRTIKLEANIHALETSVIAKLASLSEKQKNQFEALLGKSINGYLNAQLQGMEGPIFAHLKGNNGQFQLDGYYVNETLFLNKPFIAEITPTPALGKYVLSEYFPLLSGILGAEQNFKLTIKPDGFSLPLAAPLQMAKIPYASLETGNVRFFNNKQLNQVISLLIPHNTDQVSIWFTPLYFSLFNGKLTLERTDFLLANQFPNATWGTIDFVEDRVKMVMALSETTIGKAFNIPVQRPNAFLQLPLKGTIKDASIDKSKATAKIAALTAQSQGSPHGILIGTVIDLASGKYSEEHMPAPTTNPLPWSDLLKTNNDFSTTNEKESKKGLADSLIERIFR